MSRCFLPHVCIFVALLVPPLRAAETGGESDDAGTPAAGTASAEPRADVPSADDATRAFRLAEQELRALATEQSRLADARATAAFREVRAIGAPAEAGRILAFQPLADGGLVIATGAGEKYGETSLVGAVASIFGFTPPQPKASPKDQLIWLDATGATGRSAVLPCSCKGIAVAPDGAVVAVGGDRVTVFSADGEQIAAAAAPHVRQTDEDRAALVEELTEQHREMLEARQEQVERWVKAKDALEAIPEDERTPRQKRELAVAERMAKMHAAAPARDQPPLEVFIAGKLATARSIHRVAASREHLFLVASEPVGYGFAVWRCGRDFGAPTKIIGGLRGCCGQMDVQIVGDELVIAENARHRVAVYDLDGVPRRTFGAANRTDVRKGFGGCCNPMNACAGPDGTMLLSESNGLVKQFTGDGILVDIVGAANVAAGCKNSSIGLSADGTTLYYLDIQKGRIIVLEKKS